MKKYTVLIILLLLIQPAISQEKYSEVDNKVKSMGKMDSLNVATIADSLTRNFISREDKARAIFYWIANNIQPDLKTVKSNDPKKSDPVVVIQTRKANALGFSMLVQEMLSRANIRCLSVDGFIKRSSEDINEPADDINHSWNVVQLGQSPEEWYYLDAFLAAGIIDKRIATFTPHFISDYFFTNRNVFNLQHYPDNSSWHMGPGPKSIKEFYAMPVIHNYAVSLHVSNIVPATGVIKTKLKNAVSFSFNSSTEPKELTIVTGDERRPDKPVSVAFTYQDNKVSFTHNFKKDDEYPVRIFANGFPIVEYYANVTE